MLNNKFGAYPTPLLILIVKLYFSSWYEIPIETKNSQELFQFTCIIIEIEVLKEKSDIKIFKNQEKNMISNQKMKAWFPHHPDLCLLVVRLLHSDFALLPLHILKVLYWTTMRKSPFLKILVSLFFIYP